MIVDDAPRMTPPRVSKISCILRFSDASLPPSRGGPAIGEHTREVLREIGLDDQEIQALLADGTARQRGEAR